MGNLLQSYLSSPPGVGLLVMTAFAVITLILLIVKAIGKIVDIALRKLVERWIEVEYHVIAEAVFERMLRIGAPIHGGTPEQREGFESWMRSALTDREPDNEGRPPFILASLEVLHAALHAALRNFPQRILRLAMPFVCWTGVQLLRFRSDYPKVRAGYVEYCGQISDLMMSSVPMTWQSFSGTWQGTPAGPPTRPEFPAEPFLRSVVRPPNLITLVRLLGSPVLAVLIARNVDVPIVWIAIAFVVLCFSDAADGNVARRLKQESRLGQALDPVADRVLFITIYLGLLWQGELQLPLKGVVFLALAREVVLIASFVRRKRIERRLQRDGISFDRLVVHWTGKAATMFSMIGVSLIVLTGGGGLLLLSIGITMLMLIGIGFGAFALAKYFNPQAVRKPS